MIRLSSRALSRSLLAMSAALAVGACASGGGASAGSTPGPATAAIDGALATKAAPSNALPAGVTTAMVTVGDSIFNNGNCQRCHGKLGVGAANAPAFTGIRWQHGSGSYDDIVKTIVSGIPADQIKDPSHKFPMAGKGGRTPLTDDQIKAVAAYVFSISRS